MKSISFHFIGVPSGVVAGDNLITVTKGSNWSNTFTYTVLSGDHNQVYRCTFPSKLIDFL